MAAAATSAAPTPQAPLEVIDPGDQRGLVVVLTTLTLCFALLCVFIRLYVRFFANGPWKGDDALLSASAICSTIQTAVVLYGVSHGLGRSSKHNSAHQLGEIGKAAYTSDILYLVALLLSKCSTAFLILRLQPSRRHSLMTWAIVVASGLGAFVSVLLISTDCSAAEPDVNLAARCSGLFVRWSFIAAIDICTEASLFLAACWLVSGLQMRLRLKLLVVLAFSLRLPTIVFCGIRLHFVHETINATNTTLQSAYSTVWTQVELNFSILASAISCLGPFISPFARDKARDTRYARKNSTALSAGDNTEDHYGLNSVSEGQARSERDGRQLPLFRRDHQHSHSATVTHDVEGKDREGSVGSDESNKMIIRKEIAYSVMRDDINSDGPDLKEVAHRQ